MIFETGKPFPMAHPINEGCVMEMMEDGSLICMIQLPNLTREEKQAFKKSFKNYGYLETGTTPPIAIWIWGFQKPLNAMDTNFDARLVNPKYIDAFLELESGQIKNMVTFYLLDRNILQGIKIVGIDPEAMKLFHATIKKQLSIQYERYDFDKSLKGIYAYTTDELYKMSHQFKK